MGASAWQGVAEELEPPGRERIGRRAPGRVLRRTRIKRPGQVELPGVRTGGSSRGRAGP